MNVWTVTSPVCGHVWTVTTADIQAGPAWLSCPLCAAAERGMSQPPAHRMLVSAMNRAMTSDKAA